MDDVAKTKWYAINMNLLPIKVHYFMWCGAMAGVVPFQSVFAKSLGISATATGLTFTALPFLTLLFKPLTGFLADYFRSLKGIIIILCIIACCSFLSMLLITKIEREPIFRCSETNNTAFVTLDYDGERFGKNDTPHLLGNPPRCQLNCSAMNQSSRNNVTDILYFAGIFQNVVINTSASIMDKKIVITIDKALRTSSLCHCLSKNLCSLSCKPPFNSGLTEQSSEDSTFVFETYQFWIFTLLATLAGTASETVNSMGDVACYEILGDKAELYGRQRLYGALGWGITVLLVGYLNDLASVGTDHNYTPGFFLMGILLVLHLIVFSRINIPPAKISKKICKDVGVIFASYEMVFFAMGVFVVGVLSSLLSHYRFWYLQDLGASQTLLGLSLTIQCLGAETPFFFFSGWVIRKLGHFYCLSASLAAFGLRLSLYYLIRNPWLTLPVELLQGMTFGLFYATMISYSGQMTPSGTEATTFGVFGALFTGLGGGVGSLLGGFAFDRIGGRDTFFTAACVSFLCAPTFVIVQVCQARTSIRKKEISSRK